MPKSKIISLFMKISKKPTKIKNCPLEKNSKWFGHKTGEPAGFHDNVVII